MAREVLPLPSMAPSPFASSLTRHRDVAIAARLRYKDPAALGELYDAYGRSVFCLLLRIVKDIEISEDLAQETFLRVWLRAGLFDPQRGSASSWILTIARNLALDYLRSGAARHHAGSDRLADTEDPGLFADLERHAGLFQTRRLLNNALLSLNTNQRAAIDLAYFEGCTQSEIAARMGCPLGTVKTWVRGALAVLRDGFYGSEGTATRAPAPSARPAVYPCTRSSAER